jgi:hypothetical protein
VSAMVGTVLTDMPPVGKVIRTAGVPAVGHSTKPRHTLVDSPGSEKE